MSSTLATFDVFSAEHGERRRIELLDGIDPTAIQFVEQAWQPRLDDAHGRAIIAFGSLPPANRDQDTWDKKATLFGAPDQHWQWRDKVGAMQSASQRAFCIVDQGSVEALMLVDLSRKSLLPASNSADIVYVEYIAVAPWNRPRIQSPPRFKGLGSIMLATAVSLSMDESMDGRCGLHSLVQSEGFYRRCGMTDGGLQNKYRLRYFEFTPDAAKRFVGA